MKLQIESYDDALDFIHQVYKDPQMDQFDYEDCPPPNDIALAAALKVLEAGSLAGVLPDHVGVDCEGGLVLFYWRGANYVMVGCDNDGDICLSWSDEQMSEDFKARIAGLGSAWCWSPESLVPGDSEIGASHTPLPELMALTAKKVRERQEQHERWAREHEDN